MLGIVLLFFCVTNIAESHQCDAIPVHLYKTPVSLKTLKLNKMIYEYKLFNKNYVALTSSTFC